MKKGRPVLLLILIFAGLFLAAAVSWVFMTVRSEPAVPETAVLEIRLEGPLVEFADPGALAALFAGRPQSMLDIWNGLRLARADRRVTGVLLRLGLLECDWAKCAEMREAVLDFRRSGKKAIAYIEDAPLASKEYYLATACDRIVLHPLGWLGTQRHRRPGALLQERPGQARHPGRDRARRGIQDRLQPVHRKPASPPPTRR